MTIHDLAAGFAVDALDPDDLDAFTRHLPECPDCEAEVASLRETAARLGASGALSGVGAPGAAPTALRERTLLAAADAPQAPAPDTAAPRAAATSAARARRRLPVAWIGTAAAAVLAAALGIGVGGYLASDPNGPALAEHEQAMRIIAAGDAHSMVVPLGRSSLIMSEEYSGAVLMGDTVPMPAHGTEYQVWMVHADGTMDAGPMFMPDAEGAFMVVMDGDMSQVSEFMVTTEPPGGSDAPTGPAVAVVPCAP